MLYMDLSPNHVTDVVMASDSDSRLSTGSTSKTSTLEVQEDEIDRLLRKEDGKIYRKRNEQMYDYLL